MDDTNQNFDDMDANEEPFGKAPISLGLTIDDLGEQILSKILALLSAKECAMLSTVNRTWRAAAEQEWMYTKYLKEIFLLDEPLLPPSEGSSDVSARAGSYKEAFLTWQQHYQLYTGKGLITRVKAVWDGLKAWTGEHIPKVKDSLQPGVTEADLSKAEDDLQLKFPPALRAIYRIHNGQTLTYDERNMSDDLEAVQVDSSIEAGLFGGYRFYDHVVNVRMLRLDLAVKHTLKMRKVYQHILDLDPRQGAEDFPFVYFAASFSYVSGYAVKKMFFVHAESGELFVSNINLQLTNVDTRVDPPPRTGVAEVSRGQTRRGSGSGPPAGGSGGPGGSGGSRPWVTMPDGVLRWMEAYLCNLRNGQFGISGYPTTLAGPESTAINLYPSTIGVPNVSEATTKGITVSAKALYIPEKSDELQRFYSYSIRYHLRTVEEQLAMYGEGATVTRSAQLMTRYWHITNGRGEVEEVEGPGVIGEHPHLTMEEPTYVYQSCTGVGFPPGRMKGHFKFVIGSIQEPTGEEFDAECAEFLLDIPDIIF